MPTQDPLAAVLAAVAVTITILGSYALACALVPFKRCRRCHGTGRHLPRRGRNRFGRAHPCRRCHGTGRSLRAGRQVWNWINHEHHAGTHPSPPTQPARSAVTDKAVRPTGNTHR